MTTLKPAAILALATIARDAIPSSIAKVRREIAVVSPVNTIGLLIELENLGLVTPIKYGRTDATSTVEITQAGRVALILGSV